MSVREPAPGDRALVIVPGAAVPFPVTVTQVRDGAITLVQPAGPWLCYAAGEFAVEGWDSADLKNATLLFDATPDAT